MAKTGINFERCNCRSAEQHNEREKHYIDSVNASDKKSYSIFSDRTSTNTSWRNPHALYRGKSLDQILDDIRHMVKEKTGRKMQEADRKYIDKKTGMEKPRAGASPIREGVCPVKEDTKIEDFVPFINWLADHGVTVLRIDIHRDEGYENPDTHERKYNLHAHIICDWMNHDTGKSAKLTAIDCQQMQTAIAESLGMERGIPNAERGHLKAEEMRQLNAVKEEKVQVLQEVAELKQQAKPLQMASTVASGIGKGFQNLIGASKLAMAAKQRKDEADTAIAENKAKSDELATKEASLEQRAIGMTKSLKNAENVGYDKGKREADSQISSLKGQVSAYRQTVMDKDAIIADLATQLNDARTATKKVDSNYKHFLNALFCGMQELDREGHTIAWRRVCSKLADKYGENTIARVAMNHGLKDGFRIHDSKRTEQDIADERKRPAPQKSQGRGLR